MGPRAAGNDVVGLAEAGWPRQTASRAFARFTERVCSAEERALVMSAEHPQRRLWTLFAAKEAAYKALAQTRPHLVFAHRAFVVSPDLSEVRYESERLRLEVQGSGRLVHAVAFTGPCMPSWRVAPCPLGESEGQAARSLASSMLALQLGCRADEVCIVRKPHGSCWDGLAPPRAFYRGEQLPFAVSLSHHGGFVAACVLEQGLDGSPRAMPPGSA